MEQFDVVIVGAGLSGIGAAHHLQARCPGKRYVILEGRGAIGGTWDLFRYPGIRSDSDMYTLGYSFRPWTGRRAIADGSTILDYVRDTAREGGIDRHVRFGHRVTDVGWDSAAACWTITAATDTGVVTLRAAMVWMCSGYYSYRSGYTPDFAGTADFAGRIVHPQSWPGDLDHAGRRVVVIGSGATAVTLVPALAGTAAGVTMLQRSPSYVLSRPAEDRVAHWLRAVLPARAAYGLIRWRNVVMQQLFFALARRRPAQTRRRLIGLVQQALGPDHPVEPHFTPTYDPWDQRLCLVPDDDLFKAIRSGRAEVVTERIDRFVPDGIRLASGRVLPADIVVTATGLDMQLFHGVTITVDGVRVEPGARHLYKGMMLDGVPNFIVFFGYTNASWTLKADLTAAYACRLIRHMDRTGARMVRPERGPGDADADIPFVDFSSGYIARARDQLPKQGARAPWRLHQNYARDIASLRFGRIEDGTLRFDRGRAA